MKIANKYKSEYAKYKLENNAIFKYFGDEITDTIFATVPDAEKLSVKFDNNLIRSELIEKEAIFFREQYIILQPKNETLSHENIKIPDELNNGIGLGVDQALNFIYDGGHRLLLTGKKGWGKTTFLRYISRYIIPILNNYKNSESVYVNKPCVPIYISFNTQINDFNLAKEETYHKLFYDCILGKIRNCCYDYINSDINSPFYKYLFEQDEYFDYKLRCDSIRNQHENTWITSSQKDMALDEIKREIIKREDTILYSFSYVKEQSCHSGIPLIILDDLDPLHISVQTFIFTEIYKLAHVYGIKIIISMRPRSYRIVEQKIAEAIQINNQIVFSDSHEDNYLKEKFTKITTHVTKHIPNNDGIPIGDNLLLKPKNFESFFENFCEISLNKDVLLFLKSLSGGNLRKLNEFIKIYLSSGYIDKSPKMFQSLIEKYATSNSSSTLPLWVVYSSIFTNNYETIFGMLISEPTKYVVNILCNGTSTINTYLLRLHLLSFFYRNGNASFSLSYLTDKYREVVDEQYKYDDIKNAIARAIKRLNNFNLLGNNTVLEIPDANDPDKIFEKFENNAGFYMEELGRYYYDTVTTIFEYFHFMKDDINFREENDILSCIETKGDVILRFEQIIKYFELLSNEEILFYKSLDPEKQKFYIKNFAPYHKGDKIFFAQVFIENMLVYARSRTYEGIDSIVEKLTELNNKINASF